MELAIMSISLILMLLILLYFVHYELGTDWTTLKCGKWQMQQSAKIVVLNTWKKDAFS